MTLEVFRFSRALAFVLNSTAFRVASPSPHLSSALSYWSHCFFRNDFIHTEVRTLCDRPRYLDGKDTAHIFSEPKSDESDAQNAG